MEDLNIPMDLDFETYKDLTYARSELYIFDDFYRELWKTRNYNSDAEKTLLHKKFLEFTVKTETKEVGCACHACDATTFIMCFYDYR
ncbi:hypothetical protein EG68_07416 [Paragonimus skrjabini miyazakii]|uniref:Uncharacterized protein n=1 Tax=Paragonimus skrjabini miyazakii TaxID=59628 RepID=A0A8S9YPM4_9TREM|nr:hypothetical protein EG68_07416 [Paragonimus skrjabini miyazakii]